ncbi:hypothetical protein C6341_g3618 [Phytophthora cactorum]|nr:hypothetical protein C6341_g3618 [Phytophthora cactorum]
MGLHNFKTIGLLVAMITLSSSTRALNMIKDRNEKCSLEEHVQAALIDTGGKQR